MQPSGRWCIHFQVIRPWSSALVSSRLRDLKGNNLPFPATWLRKPCRSKKGCFGRMRICGVGSRWLLITHQWPCRCQRICHFSKPRITVEKHTINNWTSSWTSSLIRRIKNICDKKMIIRNCLKIKKIFFEKCKSRSQYLTA